MLPVSRYKEGPVRRMRVYREFIVQQRLFMLGNCILDISGNQQGFDKGLLSLTLVVSVGIY